MEEPYSVPYQARQVLVEALFKNSRLAHNVPEGAAEIAMQSVRFEGSERPCLPINWRFAESVAALKAYEASIMSLLVKKKYGVDLGEIVINTDHACLFFMSPIIGQILGEDGKAKPFNPLSEEGQRLIPNADKHGAAELYRGMATNIYQTKDDRYFHLHGSMNADAALSALGLPAHDPTATDLNSACEKIQAAVSQFTAQELDIMMNEKYRQAGCIAYSVDEYAASEAGKATRDAGLYEITKAKPELASQAPSWWPNNESKPSSSRRPLAGLKVVDLSRIIAGPAITRSLAEMGASVMRITSSKMTDLSAVHHDLNWGKWNAYLDLTQEADKTKLWALIRDADIVVDGYRPGALDRYGFGRDAIFESVKGRDRGIVHVRENCYGWYGPWKHRSGWQQISDICCGISLGFGRAMGLDEPVTPVFPNADFCTGIQGCAGVLHALIQRAEQGGSYGVDTALNYYSTWLAESVGEYPEDVWQEVWQRYDKPRFRHYENMQRIFPVLLPLIQKREGDGVFNPSFFEHRKAKALGPTFICPKAIAQFPNDTIDLGFDIGTRGNGVDDPFWPQDLTTEVVKCA